MANLKSNKITLKGIMVGENDYLLLANIGGQKKTLKDFANILGDLTEDDIKSSKYCNIPARSMAEVLSIIGKQLVIKSKNGFQFELVAKKSKEVQFSTIDFDEMIDKIDELYQKLTYIPIEKYLLK